MGVDFATALARQGYDSPYGDNYTFGSYTNANGDRVRKYTSASASTFARNVAGSYSTNFQNLKAYLEADNSSAAAHEADIIRQNIKNYNGGNFNYELDDDQINAILESAYAKVNGTTLDYDIEANNDTSFWSGALEAIDIFDLFDTNSAAEVASKVKKTDLSDQDSTNKTVGKNVTYGALAGTAVAVVGGAIHGGFAGSALAAVGSFLVTNPIGWGILAAGAIFTIGSLLSSKK